MEEYYIEIYFDDGSGLKYLMGWFSQESFAKDSCVEICEYYMKFSFIESGKAVIERKSGEIVAVYEWSDGEVKQSTIM